jgi:PAS domain S-box-containing protein
MAHDEDPLTDLRKRAEAALQGTSVDLSNLSPEIIQTLFQELQVHQIELELQNQELRDTQVALEDAQRKYTDLYDFAPVGYFTLNQHGGIEEVNLAGATLVGIDRNRLIQMPFSDLVHSDAQDDFYLYLRRLFRTPFSESQEILLVKSNGDLVNAQITGVAVRDEQKQISQCRIIVSNITDQKRATQQLLELAADKEHIRTLSNFLRSASHEFRTPLSNVMIALYFLKKTIASAQETEHVAKIEKQVKYITGLVDALATVARLDSNHDFHFEMINLNSFIREVSAQMQLEAQEIGVEVVIECDDRLPFIQVDVSELYLALSNILDNAVHYTSSGGIITIRAFSRGDSMIIDVQDTGIGISRADIPHLFDRFYRVDESHSIRGIGLGLAIANQIIQRHGGMIEVESQLGQGSLFRIILPLHYQI